MKIGKLLAIAVLALSQTAVAANLEIVTQISAKEMSPSNMILPASVNGMMSYKPCADECDMDYKRARLTAETTFSIAGKTVKFEDFAAEFSIVRNIKSSYALLSVDTKTRTVTSIDIAR